MGSQRNASESTIIFSFGQSVDCLIVASSPSARRSFVWACPELLSVFALGRPCRGRSQSTAWRRRAAAWRFRCPCRAGSSFKQTSPLRGHPL